jgi:hypothetical protein
MMVKRSTPTYLRLINLQIILKFLKDRTVRTVNTTSQVNYIAPSLMHQLEQSIGVPNGKQWNKNNKESQMAYKKKGGGKKPPKKY